MWYQIWQIYMRLLINSYHIINYYNINYIYNYYNI